MFDLTPRWCPCGCDTSYTIECEGPVAPTEGTWLHYTCPSSQDRLSFQSQGCWGSSRQEKDHPVVAATLNY